MNSLPISRKFFYAGLAGCVALCYPIGAPVQFGHYFNEAPRPERTIIVTGATGVLGRATTMELTKRKCRIIMACRDMDKCKAWRRELVLLGKLKSITCRHLDLEDIDSINRFADEISKEEPHIDVLINNAAIKELKERELTKYGIEKHFFVNFLAPYLLTLKLLPKLEESAKETRDSRIVNVIGSPKKSWHIDLNDINFTKRKYNSKKAYQQSKLALAYFSILLEKFNRLKKNQVYVFGMSPGTNRIIPLSDHKTGFKNDLKRAGWELSYRNLAENVCQRIIICALDKGLVKEGGSGKNYNFINEAWGWNNGWGVAAANENKAKLVWNMAADWLINAKPLVKNINETTTTAIETKPPSSEPTQGVDDQVKAQGNNKASGVLESV